MNDLISVQSNMSLSVNEIIRNMSMAASLTEMAKDLVAELVKSNLLAPDQMQQKLQDIHASLLSLKAREAHVESGAGGGGDASAQRLKDWRQSIRQHTIECLVCGHMFKQLSARHLSQHDLDPHTYRQRFGIPNTQPLAAKANTAMRRRLARANRPWEKAAANRQSQKQPIPTSAAPKGARKKAAVTS
jgi:predicted transcriptional regulator